MLICYKCSQPFDEFDECQECRVRLSLFQIAVERRLESISCAIPIIEDYLGFYVHEEIYFASRRP